MPEEEFNPVAYYIVRKKLMGVWEDCRKYSLESARDEARRIRGACPGVPVVVEEVWDDGTVRELTEFDFDWWGHSVCEI